MRLGNRVGGAGVAGDESWGLDGEVRYWVG